MSQYYFVNKYQSSGNVRSDTDLSTIAADEIAIGVPNAVTGTLSYSQVTQIATAIHKLLNSARDRHYIATGVGVRHYSVPLSGGKGQVVDNASYANKANEVSLAIGANFGFPGHGPAAGMGFYGSVLVDSQAKILLNALLDNFLNINGLSPFPPQGDVTLGDYTLQGPEGTDWVNNGFADASVPTGFLSLDLAFGALTNTSTIGVLLATSYTVVFGGPITGGVGDSINVSLGGGAGGVATVGDSQVIFNSGAAGGALSFQDLLGNVAAFPLRIPGPIIVNLT